MPVARVARSANKGARLAACLLAAAVGAALLLAPSHAEAQTDTTPPTVSIVYCGGGGGRFLEVQLTEGVKENAFGNASIPAFTVIGDGVRFTVEVVTTTNSGSTSFDIRVDTSVDGRLPCSGSLILTYDQWANPNRARSADLAGNEVESFGWDVAGNRALTNDELLYFKLGDYYQHGIDNEELSASLRELGYSSVHRLVADFHRDGRPIPLRLLVDNDSLGNRYANVGQRAVSTRCRGTRPYPLYEQLMAGHDYLCNTSTGEWTLFQRPVMPPVSEWQGPVSIDDHHCFYTHPTYPNTLTLTRGIGNCPAAPPP